MSDMLSGDEIRKLLEGQTIAKVNVSDGESAEIHGFMMESGDVYIFSSDWDHRVSIEQRDDLKDLWFKVDEK